MLEFLFISHWNKSKNCRNSDCETVKTIEMIRVFPHMDVMRVICSVCFIEKSLYFIGKQKKETYLQNNTSFWIQFIQQQWQQKKKIEKTKVQEKQQKTRPKKSGHMWNWTMLGQKLISVSTCTTTITSALLLTIVNGIRQKKVFHIYSYEEYRLLPWKNRWRIKCGLGGSNTNDLFRLNKCGFRDE